MTENVQTVLANAARTLLRPLVRILLRNGIAFGAFMEYAKQIYVDVALHEFNVERRKPSVSRTSVITGLSRKEVSRLLKAPDMERVARSERYNRAARVLTGWVRDPAFHESGGAPATLPIDGDEASFAELVRRYSGDVPARAVLDELVRVGAVEPTAGGRLRLVTRAYVPRTGEAEKIEILGQDVADLVSAIDHNLTHPPAEAFFQRKVAYDNLPREFLPVLREFSADRAQSLLEDLDRAMSEQDRDSNPGAAGTGRHRAVLGIYYYQEPVEPED